MTKTRENGQKPLKLLKSFFLALMVTKLHAKNQENRRAVFEKNCRLLTTAGIS